MEINEIHISDGNLNEFEHEFELKIEKQKWNPRVNFCFWKLI